MFALRKLPALVVRRAGTVQMLAPKHTAMYASRSRLVVMAATNGKTTGAGPCLASGLGRQHYRHV